MTHEYNLTEALNNKSAHIVEVIYFFFCYASLRLFSYVVYGYKGSYSVVAGGYCSSRFQATAEKVYNSIFK